MIDFKRPFVAIRQDPHWLGKCGFAIIAMLVPYVGQFAMTGWRLEYERRVAWGSDEELPGWDDPVRLVVRGLCAWVVSLPYTLLALGLGSAMAVVILTAVVAYALQAELGDSQTAMTIIAAVAGAYAAVLGLSLAVIPLSGSAVLRYALYDRVAAGFEFGVLWRMLRESWAAMKRVWAIHVGVNLVVVALSLPLLALLAIPVVLIAQAGPQGPPPESMLVWSWAMTAGSLLTNLVLFPVSIALGLASAHWFGQYGRIAYGLAEEEHGAQA